MLFLKYFVLWMLLYYVDALEFSRSTVLLTVSFNTLLAVSVLSMGHSLLKYGLNKLTLFLFLYAFAFPLYASIQAERIFHQPIYMGLASLRYLWVIGFAFFLYLVRYPYAVLLRQINGLNLTVALLSIVLFFFFGVNKLIIQYFMVSNQAIEIHTSEVAFVTKGAFLTTCSGLMFFSYLYYLLRLLKKVEKWDLIKMAVLMVYLVFVNKSRQQLAMVSVIYFIYFLRMGRVNGKRIFLAVLPLLALGLIIFIDSSVLDRFTSVIEGMNTTDSSTMARINSVSSVWPYIEEHYLLGIGDLSAHFRDHGFHTFFGNQFYMADIGIWGTLAMGGIVLLFIYYNIYRYSFLNLRYIPQTYREFMQFMLLAYIILLVLFSFDPLFKVGCIRVALLIYPLLGRNNLKIFSSS